MSRLKLESLTIKNYRSLRDVAVNRVGRLNLITGRNNAGKTSLLEAVRLWASQTDIGALLDIIDARDESIMPEKGIGTDRQDGRSLSGCQYLFSGYPPIDSIQEPIKISNDICTLQLSIRSDGFESGSSEVIVNSVGDLFQGRRYLELRTDVPDRAYKIGLPSYYGAHPYDFVGSRGNGTRVSGYKVIYLPSMTMNGTGSFNFSSASLWDKVALTSKELSVLNGLKIVESEIEGVSFIEGGDRRGRIPVVRMSGIESPVPLRGLGDGVLRLFQIVLAVVNAEDGFLIIDEFENGLHYSIQETAWKTILELSESLNVQVFATTHSDDCVSAFEQVARDCEGDTTMIVTRLLRENGEVYSETLERSKLALRLELGQEVR